MEENVQTQDTSLLTEVEQEVVTDVVETKTDVEPPKKEEPAVPEKYEFKLPEDVVLDEHLYNEFVPIAKELKLTQDQAQKLVDIQVKHQQGLYKQQVSTWNDTLTGWRRAAETDSEYGGKDFKTNLATARKALDTFGTKELKEALDLTGTGNHPEFLRFMVKIGKAISEDGFKVGGAPAAKKTAAEILFG